MVWTLEQRERDSVASTSNESRYQYFLIRAADWSEVWTLRMDGQYLLLGVNGERESVPVWPHRDYAVLACRDDWCGAEPVSISLDVWLDRWIPGIAKDSRLICVFPVPTNDMGRPYSGQVVGPGTLREDLLRELQEIEGIE